MQPLTTSKSTPAVAPHAHPLDEFYSQMGLQLPKISIIRGEEMPQPYRQLLVHEGDMTPTLQNYHGSRLHLDVLRWVERGSFYFREVVLVTDDGAKRVEFGAIKMFLELFPPAARREILEAHIPLGALLAKYKIEHLSRPKAFLKIQVDDYIAEALALQGPQVLYGRRNTLSDLDLRPLAEIVEILPPAN